jgi:hypothetical protein
MSAEGRVMRNLILATAALFPLAAYAAPPQKGAPPTWAPAALTLTAGTSAPLPLSATDPAATAAQLVYQVTSGPTNGSITDGGKVVQTFSQADVSAGLVLYNAAGTVAAGDSILFSVTDPAGLSTSGMMLILINTAPAMPPPVSATMIPGSDGLWHWK